MGTQNVNDALTGDRRLKQEIGLDKRQQKKTGPGKKKWKEEWMETPGKSKILAECRRSMVCLLHSDCESAIKHLSYAFSRETERRRDSRRPFRARGHGSAIMRSSS